MYTVYHNIMIPNDAYMHIRADTMICLFTCTPFCFYDKMEHDAIILMIYHESSTKRW